MNAHTAPHVSDHELSKAFHVPTPEPLEYTINMEDHEAARFNDGKNTDCWIVRKDTAIPTPVAFEAQSRREVETFYNAALAAGEKIDSGPGYRDYWSGHYAAFVYEPDGQNTEAVWYHYSKVG